MAFDFNAALNNPSIKAIATNPRVQAAVAWSNRAGLTSAAPAAVRAPRGKRLEAAFGALAAGDDGTREGAIAHNALSWAQFGGRAAKRFVSPSQRNVGSWIGERISTEGDLLYHGRGQGEPGPSMIRTSRNYLPSGFGDDGRTNRGSTVSTRPAGPQDEWADPITPSGGVRPPDGRPRPTTSAGGQTPPGAPGGPGAGPWSGFSGGPDYTHQSSTSGTGAPWFDAHTAQVSGINAKPVRNIGSPPKEEDSE